MAKARGELVVRPDPARVALASAITTAEQADAAADAGACHSGPSGGVRPRGRSSESRGEEALAKAVADQGEALAEAIGAGASTVVGDTVRAARARLVEAEDELEAAKAALERLKAGVQGPEDAATEARRAVEEAVAAVVASHAEALLRAAQAAQHEYVERCAVLHEFQRALHPWSGEHKAAANFLGAVHFAVNRHLAEGKSTAAAEWRQAVAELAQDASVRLPVPGSV